MRFLAVFLLISLAEVAVFFWVGSKIGLLWALGLAVATALIGAVLVRRAGLSALSRIQRRVNQGELPGRELSDGASILVAGAFLISPGFITDLLGFLLLVPSVRGLVHRLLTKRFTTRLAVFSTNGRKLRQGWSEPTGSDVIIDVEAVD